MSDSKQSLRNKLDDHFGSGNKSKKTFVSKDIEDNDQDMINHMKIFKNKKGGN